MPRVGTNPLKKHGIVHRPLSVTLVTSVHIPELAGYWRESLEVLQVSLESARKTTNGRAELFVFDNDSCQAVQDWLVVQARSGLIDYLMLSNHNLGKVGCFNYAFPAVTGEFVAYFDSDVQFADGWLEESLQVFSSFDNVGMVTGRPLRHPWPVPHAEISATLQYADDCPCEVRVDRGDIIPLTWLVEHAASCGRTIADFTRENGAVVAQDIRFTCNNVSAFAHAGHFQFVAKRSTALQILPLQNGATPLSPEPDHQWDAAINRLGLLRLSVAKPLVRHLGNRLQGAEGSESLMARDRSDNSCTNASLNRKRKASVLRRLLIKLHGALGSIIYG